MSKEIIESLRKISAEFMRLSFLLEADETKLNIELPKPPEPAQIAETVSKVYPKRRSPFRKKGAVTITLSGGNREAVWVYLNKRFVEEKGLANQRIQITSVGGEPVLEVGKGYHVRYDEAKDIYFKALSKKENIDRLRPYTMKNYNALWVQSLGVYQLKEVSR